MAMENSLKFLQEHFRQAALDCEIVEMDGDGRQRLLIFLGTDNREQGLAMEVTSQDLSLNGPLFSAASSENQAFVRIQFDAPYSFVVKDQAVGDVSQFLQFLNLQIELPGFYLSPLDNRILYRYVWLCKKEEVHPQLAVNVVGMMMFFQGVFESALARIASGEVTYLSLLEEFLGLEH